jgi:hypothetical protein
LYPRIEISERKAVEMVKMMLNQHIDAPIFAGSPRTRGSAADVGRGHTAPIFRELKR